MTIDELPTTISLPTRDELTEKYTRAYRVRLPLADVQDGSQPWIDGKVLADMLMPLYSANRSVGKNTVVTEARGAALERHGEIENVPRPAASGSSGFVRITAASGGTNIEAGDEIKQVSSGLRWRCTRTQLYLTGASVPISGFDTGPSTNIPADTVLEWTSPRPGCAQKATVLEDSDGNGLTGGRNAAEDPEYSDAIVEKKSNPEASGNCAQYLNEVKRTPGIAIEQAFAYPAILTGGGGTICIVFTVPPATPGGSRIPNPVQVAAVRAHLASVFPEDDGVLVADIVGQDSHVCCSVSWDAAATGWEDAAPWPSFYPHASRIAVQSATDATHFVLYRVGGSYSGVADPVAGQSIAFFNSDTGLFSKKQILSVTGSGPWTIVADATLNASDESYIPVANQRCCPWSESLDAAAAGMIAMFDALGPGEVTAIALLDDGHRRRRVPFAPKDWPHSLTDRLIEDAIEVPEVFDRVALEATVTSPTVGTPGVLAYLLELGSSLSFFPKTS
ncbi:MAG TPA: baseplate J/gp47 family protein [Polyangiaceae bacterium]|nr:baseplate J/gp47 family protein [Polyangiaceae bacterium]